MKKRQWVVVIALLVVVLLVGIGIGMWIVPDRQPSAGPTATVQPATTAEATRAPVETPTAAPTEASTKKPAEEPTATPSDDTAMKLDNTPNVLFAANDVLYAVTWNGLFRKTGDSWEQLMAVSDTLSFSDVQCGAYADGALYLLERHDDSQTWDDASQSWIETGEEAGYSVTRIAIGEDGTPGEPEKVCDVAWDVSPENWPNFYGIEVIGDAAYTLLFDYNTDTEWGKNRLYRIDLTTGTGTMLAQDYISCLTAGKDGQLLAKYFNQAEAWQEDGTYLPPELATVDTQTGAVTILGTMTGSANNLGALVYDAATDGVYYSDPTGVYRFDLAKKTASQVGYLLLSNSSRDQAAAAMAGGLYYVADYSEDGYVSSATVDPSLMPTRVLRLTSSYMVEEQIRGFAKEHPDIAIQYIEDSPYNAESITQHIQSSQAADVYTFTMDSDFALLRDKGWLADLSESSALVEAVSAMYPHLTKEFLRDGKLYAVPVYAYAYTTGYYPEAFEKVGMTEDDVPATMDELMDFLVRWDEDYAYDYEEMSAFEWSYDLRRELFSQIFSTQILACQQADGMLTFNTPTIRRLLARLDSPEMKTVFSDLNQESSGGNVMMVDYSSATAFFTSSVDVLPSVYSMASQQAKPMFLALDDDGATPITFSMQVMVVSPKSQNKDIALQLLEYVSDHMSIAMKTALDPNQNEPIEVSWYQENLKSYQESIDLVQSQLDDPATDEADKQSLRETLEMLRESMKRTEEERWATSAEDIAFYRESIAPNLVIPMVSAFSGSDNQANTIMMRYLDGNIGAEQFISEFDRIITMMQMENQ